MLTTPVAEIMTRHINCSRPDDSLAEVLAVMQKNNNSCMIIRDAKRPVGIITEHDIVQNLNHDGEETNLELTPVAEVMNRAYNEVSADYTLHQLLSIAIEERVKHFIIVNDIGELEGLVTQSDLIEYYGRTHLSDALAAENMAILAENKALQELVHEDQLMKIGNRRSMEQELERVHATFLRHGHPYVIALFDVDYFKKFNDSCGHLEGDRALRHVADSLKNQLRKSDMIFRYGGEEMLVLFTFTDLENAEIVANRMCGGVGNSNVEHPESPYKVLTVSVGLAPCDETTKSVEDWRQIVSEADDYLYEAKEAGRNRVMSRLTRSNSPQISDTGS